MMMLRRRFEELQSFTQSLTHRHGILIRHLRDVMFCEADAKLTGLAAHYELLVMLEVLEHRAPIAEALQALDLSDAGAEVVEAHAEAIAEARSLAESEAELCERVARIYESLASQRNGDPS